MSTRLVGYGGMAFTVVAALVLSSVIARSPGTHDHISNTLRDDYARTALDDVEPVNLESILADLPEFSFPPGAHIADDPSGHAPDPEPGPADDVGTGSDTPTATATAEPEVHRVTIRETEFHLDPDRIELEVGVPVELTVVNDGDQVHGIWIPDFGISEDIRSGKTKVFTFTPGKPGRIRFTCSYNLCGTEEEHARMVGFLTVS